MNQLLVKPRPLSRGDVIGVYSPSSGIESDLHENYARGKQSLLDRGYRIKEAPHTFDWCANYSSDGRTKAQDLIALFEDPEVKAILPTLGGTTAYQMLPHIDFEVLVRHPKMLFGFSDNSQTACVVTSRTGLVTFHGHSDVVFGIGDLEDPAKMSTFATGGDYTRRVFFDTLEGRMEPGPVTPVKPWRVLRHGRAQGRLLGGNIEVLHILNGSPYSPDWTDKIMYWEVTDDNQLHKVDLFLASFALSGVFSRIKGMVIGKADRLREEFFEAKHESFDEMILRHSIEHDFPIIVDADIGHDMECCMLPNGVTALMEGESLCLQESPYCECS